MKTKILFLAIIVFFSLSAFAQDRVIDNAGLLSAEQKSYLTERIASVAAAYNFDLVIVTESDIGMADPSDWADNFFDNNGYGLGPNRDGSIFLQVTGSRDYWFSQSGRGLKILNNAAFNKLEDDTVKFLREDSYFEAYRAFISLWEQFLALDASGRSYNFFQQWNVVLLIISWVLALLTGFIVVMVWKSKMNTALAQTQADAYTVSGSLAYKVKTDRFLYSKVIKTKRQTQSSSGGSSRSSSRGRGGKY